MRLNGLRVKEDDEYKTETDLDRLCKESRYVGKHSVTVSFWGARHGQNGKSKYHPFSKNTPSAMQWIRVHFPVS